MKLSDRLLTVASMIEGNKVLADVGTDHGYVPIYLAQENKITHAIAMDINEGPLCRACENIAAYNVSDRVETRLSDGLCSLKPYEAQSILIAGMGGLLINRILGDSLEAAHSAEELVLSPHSDIDKVREFVLEHGFTITDERIVREDGKYYFAIRIVNGSEPMYDEAELIYGRILPQKKDELMHEYLNSEYALYCRINENLANSDNSVRKEQVRHRIAIIEKVLDGYECQRDNRST